MNLGKRIKNEIIKKDESPRIKTSIEGLDKMLNGGLLAGRNILLSGPCGSGKTTMAMQFVCNGARLYN